MKKRVRTFLNLIFFASLGFMIYDDDDKKYEVYKILDAPFHRLDHKAA